MTPPAYPAFAKWRAVGLVAAAEVLALSSWFSATAVLPQLKAEAVLDAFHASLFTSLVGVGFVCGTLVSAVFGLADRLEPHRFFAGSALVAGLADLAILAAEPGSPWVLAARFVTGAAMAGIYPVGMKMVASWAHGDMGLLVGMLVGALTLGSGSPHLFNAFGGLDWRLTMGLAAASALVAGLLVIGARLGPHWAKAPPFEPGYMAHAWTNVPLRLANLGYLGHQWEIYAMWAWLGAFLQASFAATMDATVAPVAAGLVTFAAIGPAGAVGCLVGGLLADRIGRTTVAIAAMASSGACALVCGQLFGADPRLVAAVSLLWGATVVADSAQFSSSIIELSERSHVGTMLTTQTCVGFTLTLITIHLVPVLVEDLGWAGAFAVLALGPWLGATAMARLRRRPEARRLAGGKG
jgi:MFS family permease